VFPLESGSDIRLSVPLTKKRERERAREREREREKERERGVFHSQSRSDSRSVSTTPCRVTPPRRERERERPTVGQASRSQCGRRRDSTHRGLDDNWTTLVILLPVSKWNEEPHLRNKVLLLTSVLYAFKLLLAEPQSRVVGEIKQRARRGVTCNITGRARLTQINFLSRPHSGTKTM